MRSVSNLEELVPVNLFLCGDVMLGRGIDQALSAPCAPVLHESYVKDARDYVQLAEAASGDIPRPLSFEALWGDALSELARARPDVRLVNLETSITRRGQVWPDKEVHYRVSPENAASLAVAHVDVCTLANNHVLDWGYVSLEDTLTTLDALSIAHVGAGRTLVDAERPAVFESSLTGTRVLVFAACMTTSGVPEEWAASEERPGVNLIPDLSQRSIAQIRASVERFRTASDLVVLSLHWGPNWSYGVSAREQDFAHRLIDEAGVDVVHGHSSHHVKGIEVYRERPILYGCGDLLTDYEGIGGHAHYRGDLGLMYFASFEPSSRRLLALEMIPTRIKQFQLRCRDRADALLLRELLSREGRALGTRAVLRADASLALEWTAGDD